MSSFYALVTLAGAVLAIKEAAHLPPNWGIVAPAAGAALAGAALFVRRQNRTTDPLIDFALFRNPAFSAGVVAAAAALFTLGGVQLVTTQRFQLVDGFTPLQAGLLVAAMALGALPTGLLGGATLHLLGLRNIIGGGFAVATVGVILALIGVQESFGLLIAGLAVTGVGLGAAMSVASTAIIGNAPPRNAGMASSVEEVSYEFGGLLAVAVLGSLTTLLYSARVQLPAGTPAEAGASIGDARALADGDPAILDAASAAFTSAYSTILAVIAGVLVAATAGCVALLRRYGPHSAASSFADNAH